MKYLFTVIFFLSMISCASAQAIQCPTAEEGMTFSGPHYKTEISGRSKATCSYYYNHKLKAKIEVYFYRDYQRQRPCDSGVYADADVRSWDFQAYAYVTDADNRDFLTVTYWKQVAAEFVKMAEAWALPCDAVGRKMIRQPPELTEE